MEKQERVFMLDELDPVAIELLNHIKQHRVVAFSGELGSGKTTLISSICRLLGVEDAISSPTFSIINEYAYLDGGKHKKIFHIDAYRITSIEEARQVGIEDCFEVEGYCFIEWPERIEELLPEGILQVFLSHTESGNRLIRM